MRPTRYTSSQKSITSEKGRSLQIRAKRNTTMPAKTPIDNLRDRLVGKRFHNAEINESFTVVEIRYPLALLQYDDGMSHDEACIPDLYTEEEARMAGVSEAGIDDRKYLELPGGGPTLKDSCPEGTHRFYPLPSELGEEIVVSTYENVVRCKVCGLSGDVISDFLGHEIPTVCNRCGSDALPMERSFSPTEEWRDAILCNKCTKVVTEEQDSE